jgi:hypothetical protein
MNPNVMKLAQMAIQAIQQLLYVMNVLAFAKLAQQLQVLALHVPAHINFKELYVSQSVLLTELI